MKTTYKFILAALAATVTLASCTKDPVPGKSDSDSAVTYRTITVSFDSPTKAKLDGTKPKFQQGDMILLSDGEALDTCEVKVKGGVASITTKLEGESLDAVYPMSAVSCTEPQNITSNLLIPTRQSGKFSDANICVAHGKSIEINTLEFYNFYPILRFYVDSTIAVTSIKIQSQGNRIATETGLSYVELGTIIVDAGELGTLDKVTEERVCYVAVCNNVCAGDLTFTSETKTQGTVIRKSPSEYLTLGEGFIYNAFIPYSIKVGDQKWGYCNIGAFYPEDPGCYFAWGENKGYKWNAKAGVYGQFQEGRCFDWKNYQYNKKDDEFTEQEYKEFKAKFCPEGKLALQNDAANANWGEGWRMPTQSELADLIKVNNKSFKVDTTGGVFDGKLKIPYSGFGQDKDLHSGVLDVHSVAEGSIWASTISESEGKIMPYIFYFSCGYDNYGDLKVVYKPSVEQTSYLYRGHSIRPIYDETMSGDDAVGLKISPYTDGKTL